MQFFKDQLLKLVRRLALPGVYASLSEQALGIESAWANSSRRLTFSRFQKLVNRCRAIRWTPILLTINFGHR
jgi:hypothetical protein